MPWESVNVPSTTSSSSTRSDSNQCEYCLLLVNHPSNSGGGFPELGRDGDAVLDEQHPRLIGFYREGPAVAANPEEVVRSCMRSVDQEGVFRATDARLLRTVVSALVDSGLALEHPAQLFGPWEDLPSEAQTALRRLAEEEISRAMAFHPRGPLWPWIGHQLYALGRSLRQRGLHPRSADWAEMWSARVWKAPANLRAKTYRATNLASWHHIAPVSLAGLLAAVGRAPRWLLGDYADSVPVDPKARGFFRNKGRNVVWGYLIGIDLIPSPDGIWCVEANLNTAAYNDHYKDLWDAEGAIGRVFRTAKEWGFQTLWWHDQDLREVSPWLMATLLENGSVFGLNVIVQEDYRVPPRPGFPPGLARPGKRLTSPSRVPENTLVVRRNSYGVGSDFVISNKEPFIRGMDFELRKAGDKRCKVPAMTRMPPSPLPSPVEGLPNLVYKYPGFGKGEGVFFLRARDQAHAVALARGLDQEMGEPPGLFQPFVLSRLLPGRRVYDVRCELLVTPLGFSQVLGLRREASKSIPESVGDGIVPNLGVFTSNLATGGKSVPIPPEEVEQIAGATKAIGEALVRLLSRGFITEG